MRSLNHPGYERVKAFSDEARGLFGFIAIHSTALGPAAGGCRYWHYENDDQALTDALRLSRGMSYKNALADLPFGGGKAVIMKSDIVNRHSLFRAFGEVVEKLGGSYVTAEDVGTSVEDMRQVACETSHVSGISGGDPSPWTAMGVFLAMQEAVRLQLGRNSFQGITVAVQGVGNVGQHLCRLLRQAGAHLLVSDVDGTRAKSAADDVDGDVIAPGDIHRQSCQVFAPCALGAVLNAETIPEICAAVICGAANNQLATDKDGVHLLKRGLLYIPDYVANAGGIINVASEYKGWAPQDVTRKVQEIPRRVAEIVAISKSRHVPTHEVADEIAVDCIRRAARSAAAPVLV